MTLSRSMSIKLAALVLAVGALGGASVWGLARVTAKIEQAMDEHERWRVAYESYVTEVGVPLMAARSALQPGRADARTALEELQTAARRLEKLSIPATDDGEVEQQVRRARIALRQAIGQLQTRTNPYLSGDAAEGDAGSGASAPSPDAGAVRALNSAFSIVAQLAGRMRQSLTGLQARAQSQLTQTAWLVGSLAGAMLIGAVGLSFWQHRSVMRPLERMAAGVRRMAGGKLDQRLPERGADELAALTRDFNHMASELERLYHHLEAEVRDKSRALVQSERLASVGYLAAGVAHEINNPLGIIAGHAELAQRRAEGDAATQRTLSVISEEAFRCKSIIEKLLSLSRGSDEARERVDLAAVAREVVGVVEDLPAYRDRTLMLETEAATDGRAVVHASAAQMKQVLLNLVINALNATSPGRGRVTVKVTGSAADNRPVRVEVADNGRGMDAATLERVFEPFFTTARGAGAADDRGQRTGTGLGLSICHAIITDHGGTIEAQSDGPHRGSRFTIALPTGTPPTPNVAGSPAGATAASEASPSPGDADAEPPAPPSPTEESRIARR